MKGLTVAKLRGIAEDYGVKLPGKMRKAELRAIVRRLDRAGRIANAYAAQRNGGESTPAQSRRMRKAENRADALRRVYA